MAVKMYNGDEFFTRCCKAAQIQPTKRQFKKYIDQRGKAYTVGKPLVEEEDRERKEAAEAEKKRLDELYEDRKKSNS